VVPQRLFGDDRGVERERDAARALEQRRVGLQTACPPWRREAQRLFEGQGSYGNGAAMRAAPIGAYFADDRDLPLVRHPIRLRRCLGWGVCQLGSGEQLRRLERNLELTVQSRHTKLDALDTDSFLGVTCPPVLRRCPLPILRAFVLDRREAAKG
jgi:hypothetical protein